MKKLFTPLGILSVTMLLGFLPAEKRSNILLFMVDDMARTKLINFN